MTEEVLHEEFNRMRGRLCGLIESWGLPERQERAAVSTLKSLSYDTERKLAEAFGEHETNNDDN